MSCQASPPRCGGATRLVRTIGARRSPFAELKEHPKPDRAGAAGAFGVDSALYRSRQYISAGHATNRACASAPEAAAAPRLELGLSDGIRLSGDAGAPVGSPTRRQTTAARYAGGEHGRTGAPQELRPRRSRRSRTATRTVVPGRAKTTLGRVARDTPLRRSLRSLRPCPATGPARHRPRARRASARGRSGTALAPARARPYRSSLLRHLDIRLLAASVLTVVPTV